MNTPAASSALPPSERVRRTYDACARLLAQQRPGDPAPVVSADARLFMTLVDQLETAGVALSALDPFRPERS